MKKLYCIFLLLIFVWSCHDNADFSFQGKDAVYFQLESEDYYWTRTLDSVVYTFAGKGVNEDTLWLRVNLQGNASPENRMIKVAVDESRTTAKVALHYEALKSEYILPGDSVYTYIPIIIYNKDQELENKQVEIVVVLQPTLDLELGISDRRSCRLLVSNTLNKPTYWDSTIKYDFGVYSRKKHELCIQVLGRDFPTEGNDYNEERTMWQIYGTYMSDYFEENYPIYDENEVIIEPW